MKTFLVVMASMHAFNAGLAFGGVGLGFRRSIAYRVFISVTSVLFAYWAMTLLLSGLGYGTAFLIISFIIEALSVPLIWGKDIGKNITEGERIFGGWISIGFAVWALTLLV